MTTECYCFHENDRCGVVLVASPHMPSIQACGQDGEMYLYNKDQEVILSLLQQQHATLVTKLRELGVEVMDVVECLEWSNAPSPLLGNLVFTRDPILCTRKGVVLGRFKEGVRRSETDLLRHMLPTCFGIPIQAFVEGEESVVEGGDFIPAGDTCFIGIGNRTNAAGVQEMMDRDLFGTERVVVVKHPADGDMHAIHLDCYMGLVGRSVAVLWDVAALHVRVDEYVQENGSYKLVKEDVILREYMESHGWTVMEVPTSVQRRYGCNLLYIGEGKVLTQDSYVSEQLASMGYHPICLPFSELHKMYGGIRCATQVLLRHPKI